MQLTIEVLGGITSIVLDAEKSGIRSLLPPAKKKKKKPQSNRRFSGAGAQYWDLNIGPWQC